MNRLILHSTPIAQWYSLVTDAEDLFGERLDTDTESYLVYLLERYTNRPDLTASILALDYLKSLEASGKLRADKLRDVGDQCLLFSGFFPELADKRRVTVSYFVEIGRHAYNYLSMLQHKNLSLSKLYALLRQQYIKLLDLLFSIRELSGEQQALTPLQAEELWRNMGSQYALRVLKKHNKGIITPHHIAHKIH